MLSPAATRALGGDVQNTGLIAIDCSSVATATCGCVLDAVSACMRMHAGWCPALGSPHSWQHRYDLTGRNVR